MMQFVNLLLLHYWHILHCLSFIPVLRLRSFLSLSVCYLLRDKLIQLLSRYHMFFPNQLVKLVYVLSVSLGTTPFGLPNQV